MTPEHAAFLAELRDRSAREFMELISPPKKDGRNYQHKWPGYESRGECGLPGDPMEKTY